MGLLHIGLLEAFLLQLLIYIGIYMMDNYIGFMICLVALFIASAILLLSFVFEFIEPSKVPRQYYYYLGSAVVAPLVVLLVFSFLMEGSFAWMEQ